jgi:hypothetical protein
MKIIFRTFVENFFIRANYFVRKWTRVPQSNRITDRKTNCIAREKSATASRTESLARHAAEIRRRYIMSVRMTALMATAALLAGTAFAAAQSDMYQNGRDQFSRNVQQNSRSQLSRNAAPNRAARGDSYAGDYRNSWNYRDSYAGNYMNNGQLGWGAPASGYYDFAGPGSYYSGGPSGYYDQAYWRGAYNVVPSLAPNFDPYAGTYFNGVAPW